VHRHHLRPTLAQICRLLTKSAGIDRQLPVRAGAV
jgi:hypothetical protein